MRNIVIILGCLMLATVSTVAANENDLRNQWSFHGIHSITIEVITGHVSLCSTNQQDISVLFENDAKHPETITPSVDTVDGMLTIKESTQDKHAVAKTGWTIMIPDSAILKSIHCSSALGDIRFDSLASELIVAHAATGRLTAVHIKATTLQLSTTSMPLRLANAEILHEAKCASATGGVELAITRLPDSILEAASTAGTLQLVVPDFGEHFTLTIDRNAGAGHVISPFKCTEESTSRLHPRDTYETTRCVVKHGTGGPTINLLTGSGSIKIVVQDSTENKSHDKK